jgi:ketosteroid isomerase-like protein
MSMRRLSLSLSSVALTAFVTTASAQTWSPEQQDVWRVVEQSWKLAVAKDLSWIDTMVHPNVSLWDTDSPAPQNKASLLRWGRYQIAVSTVLEYELFPVSITIAGNVAVTHYRFVLAREDHKKEQKTLTGRYTDVWVKEGGRWLLFTSVGANDPTK